MHLYNTMDQLAYQNTNFDWCQTHWSTSLMLVWIKAILVNINKFDFCVCRLSLSLSSYFVHIYFIINFPINNVILVNACWFLEHITNLLVARLTKLIFTSVSTKQATILSCFSLPYGWAWVHPHDSHCEHQH